MTAQPHVACPIFCAETPTSEAHAGRRDPPMRLLTIFLALLVLLLTTPPTYASHGMVQLADCATHEWSADLTKGRTDGMVVHVEHTIGCKTYIYTNLVGADREELASNSSRERAWQTNECQRIGKLDTVNLFNYGWHLDIDPASVHVTCTPYAGPD